MAGGLVAEIWRAYGDPRGAMARRIAAGRGESQTMGDLFLACGLAFVASMPNAVRAAQALAVPDALAGAVSAHLFGYLFVAPLLLYGLAAALHLSARACGGRGGFLDARAALFWAALIGAPIALALSLAGVAVEIVADGSLAPLFDYLVYAGAAFWLWLLAASLAEAEGFTATYPVAAALILVGGGAAAGLGALAQAGATAG